jgi:hypothetical protein
LPLQAAVDFFMLCSPVSCLARYYPAASFELYSPVSSFRLYFSVPTQRKATQLVVALAVWATQRSDPDFAEATPTLLSPVETSLARHWTTTTFIFGRVDSHDVGLQRGRIKEIFWFDLRYSFIAEDENRNGKFYFICRQQNGERGMC